MVLLRNDGSPEDVLVGGQAVIEGVMMRTPHAYAVAVRRPGGELAVKKEPVRRLAAVWKPFSWPVARGFAVLVQSLMLGIRCLNFSFTVAAQETGAEPGAPASPRKDEFLLIFLSMGAAVVVAVLLFILAPLWLATWMQGHVPAARNWVVFNLVDGLIRLVFFLCYILLISLMKDIRRVFEFHGAEHMVVHTWEAGEDLTVENARLKSALHPRCGTSFLLFVMVVSIVVFSLFKFDAFWAIFLSRVLLIPLIAGLSYELIRFSAPRSRRGFFHLVVWPGLVLQRLTTRRPSEDQLEVAIFALREALLLDGSRARAAHAAA